MLVLTRKENETIHIGDDIVITMVRTQGGSVRIGIDAPKSVKILRGELQRCDGEGQPDDVYCHGEPVLPQESRNRLAMAGLIKPLRSEKVTRQPAIPAVDVTQQTISA